MRTTTHWALAAFAAAALALAGCGGSSNTKTTGNGGGTPPMTPAQLVTAATTALDAAKTAVDMVMDDSNATTVSDADSKLAAARTAVVKVPAAERSALSQRLGALENMLANRKSDRTAAMKVKANMMKADAMKLYSGIKKRVTEKGESRHNAIFSDVAGSRGNSGIITDINKKATLDVFIGNNDADKVSLKKDGDAEVASLHDWNGSKYSLTHTNGDTYMAMVYDNATPTGVKSFKEEWCSTSGDCTEDGWLIKPASLNMSKQIAIPQVDRSGTFHPEPTTGTTSVVQGKFNGVPGTYTCTPKGANKCAARKAASGQELGGTDADRSRNSFAKDGSRATWRFRADDADADLISTPDKAFVTYGWWLKKSRDGMTWTASSFYGDRGAQVNATINTVFGEAVYKGGAAGLYAFSSGTGGVNDSGQFTADVMLTADFDFPKDHGLTRASIEGTIDNFKTMDLMGGGNKEDRNWSVKLAKMSITRSLNFHTGSDDGVEGSSDRTTWTMNGIAAPASGQWDGQLYESNLKNEGLPFAAVGTFYSEYNNDGRMVGAFGASSPE